MAHSYTQDDLILFMYGELSEKESFNVRKAIDTDPELFLAYHQMLQVMGSLDTLKYEPDPSSVELVLEHSQHQEEHFH